MEGNGNRQLSGHTNIRQNIFFKMSTEERN